MKTSLLIALAVSALTLSADAKNIRVSVCNDTYNSSTTIHFADGGTTGFDRKTDKLMKSLQANKINYIFSTDGNRRMYENTCTMTNSYQAVPLSILVGDTGKCELLLEDLDNDLAGMSFSLTDAASGKMYALTPGNRIDFGLHDLGMQRNFILNVFPTPQIEATPVSCYNSGNGTVSIGFNGGNEWTAQLRNMKELVAHMAATGNSAYFENLSAGVYFAQIRMNNLLVWEELVSVRRPAAVKSAFAIMNDTLQPGEQLIVSTTTGGHSHFYWEFGDHSNSQLFAPSHSYDSPGAYIVSLTTADVAGCISVTKKTVIVTAPFVSNGRHGCCLFSE